MIAYRDLALWRALLCAGALAACAGDGDGSGGAASSATSTTTGRGGGGAGGASSGGGEAPLPCDPGSYTSVPVGECDLLQQNCPPGNTCQPVSLGGNWSTKCLGGTGLKGAGKSCVGQGECAEGLFCITGNPGNVCAPVCCPETGQPCGGGQCLAQVPYGPYSTRLCTYDPQCQLFDPDACSSGGECHIADPEQGLATCTPKAPQQSDEGGSCAFINGCRTMQDCFNNICRYYCLTDLPGDLPPGEGGCPAGQACQPANFGISGVGVCQPM
jgi:hypothetical protein